MYWTPKNKNHLFYNTMDHFLPTQLLPFTCSLNFFCNIALNGLPDVDLGIYNENFLNHKLSCDWKNILKTVHWTIPYPQSRSHHVPVYGGRAFVDTRLQALWWLYLRHDCICAELLAFITQNDLALWDFPLQLVFEFESWYTNISDDGICNESPGCGGNVGVVGWRMAGSGQSWLDTWLK